jgi:hypothetical protein
MDSERIQRQIERLLDEIDTAASERNWATVQEIAQHVLTFDPDHVEARAFLAAAERGLRNTGSGKAAEIVTNVALPAVPSSFALDRYQVRELLGEGGKKRVYRAHDTLLDRDVAFALIHTEGLDDASRQRIHREGPWGAWVTIRTSSPSSISARTTINPISSASS